MRRFLAVAAAFVVSAVAGAGLLVLLAAGIFYGQMLLVRHRESGIGAMAGGVSELAMTLVPLLCGVIGSMIVARRITPRG